MKKFPHIRNGKINCMNCLHCKIVLDGGNGGSRPLGLLCKKGYWEDESDLIQLETCGTTSNELESRLKDYAEGCLEFEPMDE